MGFSILNIILFLIIYVNYKAPYVSNTREYSLVNAKDQTSDAGRCCGIEPISKITEMNAQSMQL